MLKGLSQAELEDAIRLATRRTVKDVSRKRDDGVDTLDLILAALAHRRMRHIVDLVRRQPQTAREISNTLQLQPGVVSRYLAKLREAGVTEERQSGRDTRERIISVKADAFAAVQTWIGSRGTSLKSSDTD